MKTIAILAAAAAMGLTAAPALAATYVTDTATFTGIGDVIGSPYDQITLNSVTGTADGPGTYLVNTVDFTVGINSTYVADYTGTFTDTGTVDGSPFSYSVPYMIHIDTSDTITLGGNTVNYDGGQVHFNELTFTDVGPGTTVSGDLTATVSSAPEPSIWLLMFGSIAGIGLMLRQAKAASGLRLKEALSA